MYAGGQAFVDATAIICCVGRHLFGRQVYNKISGVEDLSLTLNRKPGDVLTCPT